MPALPRKPNYYWPVYINLENEVSKLATEIHFSDEMRDAGGQKHCQLYTYSLKIAELIIRICIEIESISKDLYEQEGGNINPVDESGKERDLYFDTDCLKLLDDKWNLKKKEVIISCPHFYFSEKENYNLTPLNKSYKRGTSGADWKQAYQAIKHKRVESLYKASIKHLIRSLAALYILNIYYKDDIFQPDTLRKPTDFWFNPEQRNSLISNGSSLFVARCVYAEFDGLPISGVGEKSEFSPFIFIEKHTDSAYKEIKQRTENSRGEMYKILGITPDKPDEEIRITQKQIDRATSDLIIDRLRQAARLPRQIILNKNTVIYPQL